MNNNNHVIINLLSNERLDRLTNVTNNIIKYIKSEDHLMSEKY